MWMTLKTTQGRRKQRYLISRIPFRLAVHFRHFLPVFLKFCYLVDDCLWPKEVLQHTAMYALRFMCNLRLYAKCRKQEQEVRYRIYKQQCFGLVRVTHGHMQYHRFIEHNWYPIHISCPYIALFPRNVELFVETINCFIRFSVSLRSLVTENNRPLALVAW